MMTQQDLFMTSSAKFWLWCKQKKLFSSVDISKYAVQFYYLRANRSVREWCEGDNPRLLRLTTHEKIRRGLWDLRNANIAYYELNPKWREEK